MPVVKTQGVAVGMELLPDGLYEAVVTRRKNTDDESKSYVTFTLKRVVRSDDATDDFVKAANGKQTMKTYSWKETAIWSWKRDMVHAGVDPKQLERVDTDTDKIIDALIGRQVFLEVRHHSHEGKVYNDIEIVEPEDSWGAAPAAAAAK